ncbi:uncharacterized protein LOC131687922 isoform X2 [Topomyia yanbarensis]|uniref:uncharacterized protein LOC131687922 isoform X2 n=1 Tax=Topomyia yanbarensis TaxID=2498891 RepID=UPI00273CE216|nr:uncharacterized protein LOC131687922 isoform X2 [Topomyia yanbarensis]
MSNRDIIEDRIHCNTEPQQEDLHETDESINSSIDKSMRLFASCSEQFDSAVLHDEVEENNEEELDELLEIDEDQKIHNEGNYTITMAHLQDLLKRVGKDQHLLTLTDLCSNEKMRFEPTLKIMNPEVRRLLNEHVPGSKGTILLLKIMDQIYTAYTAPDIPALQRVMLIWSLETLYAD